MLLVYFSYCCLKSPADRKLVKGVLQFQDVRSQKQVQKIAEEYEIQWVNWTLQSQPDKFHPQFSTDLEVIANVWSLGVLSARGKYERKCGEKNTTKKNQAIAKVLDLIDEGANIDTLEQELFHQREIDLLQALPEARLILKRMVTSKTKTKQRREAEEFFEEAYPWQLTLQGILDGKPEKRIVHWVYEEMGNVGKTCFINNYSALHPDDTVVAQAGINEGNLATLCGLPLKLKTVLIDVARSDADPDYKTLEKIKSGIFISPKYHIVPIRGDPTHIAVFSNRPPNTKSMSADRWRVGEITNGRDINWSRVERNADGDTLVPCEDYCRPWMRESTAGNAKSKKHSCKRLRFSEPPVPGEEAGPSTSTQSSRTSRPPPPNFHILSDGSDSDDSQMIDISQAERNGILRGRVHDRDSSLATPSYDKMEYFNNSAIQGKKRHEYDTKQWVDYKRDLF